MTIQDGFPAASGTVTSTELRKDLAGLVLRDTSGTARAGVFPRNTSDLVTAKATMAVDVAAFEGCAVRGGGPIFIANDGTVTVALDAAPGSNSRIDVIYFMQHESASPYSDSDDLPVITFEKGTAAPVPSKPTIPTGAVELATVLIPSGVSATNAGGVVITQTFAYTTTTGGELWVRNSTERGALGTYPYGTRVRTLDETAEWIYDASGLHRVPTRVPVAPSAVTNTGGSQTPGIIGEGTFSGVTALELEDILPAGAKKVRVTLTCTTVTTADGAITLQVGVGGTPLTSGVYFHESITATGTSTLASQGNAGTDTSATVGRVSSGDQARFEIEIMGADLAERTFIQSQGTDGEFSWTSRGQVRNTTAYTDLTFAFTNSAVVTGRYLIEAEF